MEKRTKGRYTMDSKDKAIIWFLYVLTAMVLQLNTYGCIIGAIIVGIIIKVVDVNFTQIIYWIREHFNNESRQ